MFIAETFPIWGFLIVGIVFITSLGFFLKTEEKAKGYAVLVSFLAAFSSIIPILTLLLIFPIGEKTFSNPAQRPDFSIGTVVNKDEMNAKIAETIDAGKVSVSVDDGDSSVVKSLGQGDIFDFTAIDDGSQINGSFYFTDDTMEIIIEDEQQFKEEFSVSINE